MGEASIEVLKRARENFVRKRREMAEQMVPHGAAASHFAPNFADIQVAIEAIDRAILDELGLPDEVSVFDDAERTSNVERVDFKNV